MSELFEYIAGVLGCAIIIAIPGIPIWQAYNYLRYGVWEEISCLTILEYFDVKSDWVAEPNTWLGMHSVLEWTHGSALAIILGIFWILMATQAYK
jgi:hypothetical protein